VEHSRSAGAVEHDAGTRINTRTPHYVLLLQVLIFPVSCLRNQEARDASPLGVLRASSPGACVGRTSPVARHPASCILHPASRCKASCILQAVARRPASCVRLAGGWLGWLGWLVVGGWLVGGWLAGGTRHRNATLGECTFAAGCWLLVAGCWLLVAGCWLLVAGCWAQEMQPSCYALAVYTERHFSQLLGF